MSPRTLLSLLRVLRWSTYVWVYAGTPIALFALVLALFKARTYSTELWALAVVLVWAGTSFVLVQVRLTLHRTLLTETRAAAPDAAKAGTAEKPPQP